MDEIEGISTPILKSERIFVIQSYSTEEEPMIDIPLDLEVTADELDIGDNATQEEIEDKLLDWLGDKLDEVFSGYIWYELNDGVKMNWLNPDSDNWSNEDYVFKINIDEEE